jgi:hypothetical protein
MDRTKLLLNAAIYARRKSVSINTITLYGQWSSTVVDQRRRNCWTDTREPTENYEPTRGDAICWLRLWCTLEITGTDDKCLDGTELLLSAPIYGRRKPVSINMGTRYSQRSSMVITRSEAPKLTHGYIEELRGQRQWLTVKNNQTRTTGKGQESRYQSMLRIYGQSICQHSFRSK